MGGGNRAVRRIEANSTGTLTTLCLNPFIFHTGVDSHMYSAWGSRCQCSSALHSIQGEADGATRG